MRIVRFLFFINVLFISCHQSAKRPSALPPDAAKADSSSIEEPLARYDAFGFRIDTVSVQDHKILANESLYLILDKFDFSAREIYTATKKAREIFDVQSFKPGQRYRTYASSEKGNRLFRLVWQPNPVDYVVLDWRDSLRIYKTGKTITTQLETAAAEIENSLYETMMEEDLSPLLAYKLSEIYAWEIDFFSLRKGDRFKAVYEKKLVDDAYYEIGEIHAAEFMHRGEVYSVFKFEGDSVSGYFDEDGQSVQKALLKAPFKYGQRISSRFSHSRFHPVLKRRMPHYGVDYAAPRGTPVLSVGDGTVAEARYRGANGNIVKIRHNGMYETAYLHLKGFARGIRRGARVEQGEVIGYVGKTGRVTGTHLDYRIYKNSRPVNPLSIDLPSSESIPEEALDHFHQLKQSLQKKLDAIKGPALIFSQR